MPSDWFTRTSAEAQRESGVPERNARLTESQMRGCGFTTSLEWRQVSDTFMQFA